MERVDLIISWLVLTLPTKIIAKRNKIRFNRVTRKDKPFVTLTTGLSFIFLYRERIESPWQECK